MINSLKYDSFESLPKDIFQNLLAYTCAKDLTAYGALCRVNKTIRSIVEQVFDHSLCGYAALISACQNNQLPLLKKWIVLPLIEQKLKKNDETLIAVLQLGLIVAIIAKHVAITQYLIEDLELNPTITFNPLDKATELKHKETHSFIENFFKKNLFFNDDEDVNFFIKNRLIGKVDFVFDFAIKYDRFEVIEGWLTGKKRYLRREVWCKKFIEIVLGIQKANPSNTHIINRESIKREYNLIFKRLVPHLKDYCFDSKSIFNLVMEIEAIELIEILLNHLSYDSDIDYDILNWAIIRNFNTIFKNVLEKINLDPSIRNNKALYLAIINNRETMVEELLKHVYVDAVPNSVYQAIRWAKISDRKNIIKKLLESPRIDPWKCKDLITKKMFIKAQYKTLLKNIKKQKRYSLAIFSI